MTADSFKQFECGSYDNVYSSDFDYFTSRLKCRGGHNLFQSTYMAWADVNIFHPCNTIEVYISLRRFGLIHVRLLISIMYVYTDCSNSVVSSIRAFTQPSSVLLYECPIEKMWSTD